VTLKLGKSTQLALPSMDFTGDTMKEILDGIAMISAGKLADLEKAIPDDAYRGEFYRFSEQLSPDGDDIRTVAFTTGSQQEERIVALTAPKKELRARIHKATHPPQHTAEIETEHVGIHGVLLEADATRQKAGIIEVVDSNGVSHKIIVPRGMMRDIVEADV